MTLKKWILRSIPLLTLLKEWAKTRDLILLEENQFSSHIKELLHQNRIGIYPTNTLLVDYKNYHTCLFAKEERLSNNLIQDYIQELEEFLYSCGRNKEDYDLIKIVSPEKILENRTFFPLFFLIWKPEKPLLEQFLSGNYQDTIKYNQNSKLIKKVQEDFYVNYHENVEGYYNLKKLEFNKNQYLYKCFIKKIYDKYIVLFLAEKREDFKLEYFKNLVEFYVYSDRPVLKFEEYLRNVKHLNKSIILLELKQNGNWKGIFYNCISLFYRNRKQKLSILPNYQKSRKYIQLANFYPEDFIILLPTIKSINDKPKFPISEQEVSKELENYNPGKALLIGYKKNEH